MIKQKYPRDCAICCLAAATNLDYEEVAAAAGVWFDPWKGTTNIWKVISNLGIKRAQIVSKLTDRPALVSYFVRDGEDGTALTHMKYWDGSNMHDPANKPSNRDKIFRIIEL